MRDVKIGDLNELYKLIIENIECIEIHSTSWSNNCIFEEHFVHNIDKESD
ncbi:MAG: hypothetical protein RSA29_02805 [Clostridium sp.]